MALRERLFKAFHERNALQRHLARRVLFGFCQRLGLHVTGDHFYEIVPNTRLVAANYSAAPRALPGIDWRLRDGEARVLRLLEAYGAEYLAASERFGFREKNHYFRGLDALLLYLNVRELKPGKIIEIGQGMSTRLILAALERNVQQTGQSTLLISIDPYARVAPPGVPELISLQIIQRPVQEVPMDPLLPGCGLLFVDSSHVHKFGSDVAWEFARLYPLLPPNTLLHLHDIFSPYDYPLEWIVKEKRFWNEQYVLEAFLTFNAAFEVELPVHLLARQSPAVLEAVRRLPLDPRFEFSGSSFYLRRKEWPAPLPEPLPPSAVRADSPRAGNGSP